jgi:hypothetical protein
MLDWLYGQDLSLVLDRLSDDPDGGDEERRWLGKMLL